MSLELALYLWTRLGAIHVISVAMLVLSGICFITIALWLALEADTNLLRYIRPTLITFSVALAIIVLVPSKQDAVIIYLVPKIVEHKTTAEVMEIVNRLPAVLRKQVNEYLSAEKKS